MDYVVVPSDKVLDPDIVLIAILLHMLMVLVALVLCGRYSFMESCRRYDSYFDYCAALVVGLGAHRLILHLGLVKAL